MQCWKIGCLGMAALVVIGFFIFTVIEGNNGFDVPVDGMQCGVEMNGYHVHSHLTLSSSGKPIPLYAGIGWSRAGNCWYWIHTHSADGLIHVEGPDASFDPTLGKFFDVWHEPLTRRRLLSSRPGPKQHMRITVDGRRFSGKPRMIRLGNHTDITIEIGPPFLPVQRYRFPAAGGSVVPRQGAGRLPSLAQLWVLCG